MHKLFTFMSQPPQTTSSGKNGEFRPKVYANSTHHDQTDLNEKSGAMHHTLISFM